MVVSAESPIDGRVAQVDVKTGDVVTQGQVIAVVANPALERQAEAAVLAIDRLEAQDAEMRRIEDAAIAAVGKALDVRAADLTTRIARAEQNAADLRAMVETKRDLVKQGLLAEGDVVSASSTLLEAERILADARGDAQKVAAERLELGLRHEQERQRRRNLVADARAAERALRARLDAERHVVAPRPGRVVQVQRTVGDLVRHGGSVAVISDAGDGALRCYAFFPLAEGKRAHAAMAARIEPTVADRERYGVVRGVVRDVEPVVGTRESLTRVIHSAQLAEDIEKRYGGFISAVIDLETDPSTPTGLRWTGGRGIERPLTPGTLCNVEVVTEDVAPVALLVPWLRQFFGG
jgi:HlyD family secretion protein